MAFLGPAGTFTEEALLTQKEYALAQRVPMTSMADVLDAVCNAEVDLGFTAIENALEGTVTAAVDSLIFDVDVLIQREVILDVHLALVAAPGTDIADIKRLASFPHAFGQCRRFLHERLRNVELVPATSTAEAARLVAALHEPGTAALSNRLAASLNGLEVLAEAIEDHPENQTRFVAVARHGIPAPTGHDKTSIVCFQHEDHPGSLHAILSEFAARSINLTKLESRPTKQGLGSYCFLVDLEGHIADEVVADCLKVLRAELASVKFLGSFPTAGKHTDAVRRRRDAAWKEATDWIASLRSQIT